jgi:sulfhydrogenase subunit beta (sulfur reductase)
MIQTFFYKNMNNRESAVKRKIIKRDDLRKWLEEIEANYDLYAPVPSTVVNFGKIEQVDQVCFDFKNTVLSTKALFFPQSEELFSYAKESEGIRIKTTEDLKKERVLFGIRPCDVRALSILDMVFGGEFQDSHYIEKRRKTALLGIGCTEPSDTCFCSTFGIDSLCGEGTDIFLIDNKGYYTVKEVNTQRGRSLIDLGDTLFTTQEKEPRTETEIVTECVDISKITKDIEKTQEDFWNNKSDPCLSCGVCTYVCPTCQCFDVEDEEKKSGGARFRTWDFCMSKDFARMASGENPRSLKGERFRHRYFHKFDYFPKKYDVMGCVGCGRCILHCPVSMDIRKVLDGIRAKVEE